jgi:hypothetical protein
MYGVDTPSSAEWPLSERRARQRLRGVVFNQHARRELQALKPANRLEVDLHLENMVAFLQSLPPTLLTADAPPVFHERTIGSVRLEYEVNSATLVITVVRLTRLPGSEGSR